MPPSGSSYPRWSSANPGRQKEPHAHSINLDPANRFAFAADLGTDHVYSYRFDAVKGTLAANDPVGVKLAPGSHQVVLEGKLPAQQTVPLSLPLKPHQVQATTRGWSATLSTATPRGKAACSAFMRSSKA